MRGTGQERGSRQENRRGGVNNKGEGATVQATVPGKSRADVSVHGFWKLCTYTLFDIRSVNLDAGSYLCQTSSNALKIADK